MCAICKKSVCPDCKAPISLDMNNKIICKFCYEDLEKIQKKIKENSEPKAKVVESPGIMERLFGMFSPPPEKECNDPVHLADTILGACIACRKNICPECQCKDAKMTSGYICKSCYRSLYDVQGELERDRKAKLIGSIRGFFFKIGRTARNLGLIIAVTVAISIFLGSCGMWLFYQLHAESFDVAKSDWQNSKYSLFFKEDIPDILHEAKDRFVFNWENMNDPTADFETTHRKKFEEKYESIFQEKVPETKTIKDIVDAIREVKDVMRAQEAQEGNQKK